MALSLASQRLSHLTIGIGSTTRRRLFPGDLPIGVTTTGRVVSRTSFVLSSGWRPRCLVRFDSCGGAS